MSLQDWFDSSVKDDINQSISDMTHKCPHCKKEIKFGNSNHITKCPHCGREIDIHIDRPDELK